MCHFHHICASVARLPVYYIIEVNQSVENAGVAFLNGANERKKKEMSSLKKNKQTVIYEEQVRTNKAKDYQSQGRTGVWDELRQVSKGRCIIAPIERYSGYTYVQ